jgi:hypothetical protein
MSWQSLWFRTPHLVRRAGLFASLMKLKSKKVTEERPMPTTLKGGQKRSATTTKKEERERDQALAMREYEAERLAIQTNMERLRALRLAKEAGNMQVTKTSKPQEGR